MDRSTYFLINKTQLPPATVAVAGVLLAIFGLGPNGLLTLCSIGALLLGTWLLWRPAESPILLFVFCIQWLQASIKIYNANWLNKDVSAISDFGGDIRAAILLSVSGAIVLAVGMRLGAGPWRPHEGLATRYTALAYPPNVWFKLYCGAFLTAFLAQSFAWAVPGLSQPLLALASLKWAFYWMLAYATFVHGRGNRIYLALALATELVLGVGGYFSDFKTVLFFTSLALVAAGVRVSVARAIGLSALIAVTFFAGIIWTAVKKDYRNIVSGGEKSQIVVLDYSDRTNALIKLVTGLNGNKLGAATQGMFDRLSYVDFFGIVLDTVPFQLPYENGGLWLDAITRPFMPRLFFPDKAIIDDSERTNYYTGLAVAGSEAGTSISLGYMAESYIDFGSPLMMVPILGLGLVLGAFYRKMIALDRPRPFLGAGLATSAIYGASFLESSITKVFGGLVVTVLMSWVISRYIAPRYVPWLRTPARV